MKIKDAFVKSVQELFTLFNVSPQFIREEESEFLSSTDQVNILNSFSHTLKGNVVFGLSKSRALKMASLSIGREIETFNAEAKKTISDITTFAVNLAIGKFRVVNSIYISPPVLITGDNLFSMISRVKTTKLVFQLNEDFLSVAYCIEENSETV